MSDKSIKLETDSDDQLTPPEIAQIEKNTIENVLPSKSKEKYTNTYKKFIQWTITKETKPFSEDTILTYLTELSKTHKPSTLWAIYSMLKTTLNINNNININKYDRLIPFLKRQSQGYTPKRSKVLTSEQIQKFLNEADDQKYLLIKVAMIFGICGACRREELTNIKVNDIEDKETILIVKIPTTKTYKPRSFIITDEFYTISKRYINLRPRNVPTSRFFLNYKNGKCTQQPVGINKFGKIPTIIASYLQLANPHSYTGHTFRRTSAKLLADSGADIILKRHASALPKFSNTQVKTKSNLDQHSAVLSKCDKGTNTSLSLLRKPTRDKGTRISPERIRNMNVPNMEAIRKRHCFDIKHLRREIQTLKEQIYQKDKKIAIMKTFLGEVEIVDLIND